MPGCSVLSNTSHHKPDLPMATPAPEQFPGGSAESNLRRTAKRISQRTTDLMAIAIVSIGILTVSGRLTEWWNTDPNSGSSPAVTASRLAGTSLHWGAGESAVSLLAGGHPVRMERRVLTGEQDRIDGILRDRLVHIVEESDGPALSSPEDHSPVATDTLHEFHRQEQRLLALLENLPPVERKPGMWNLYRLDRNDNPIPGTFLIATRFDNGLDEKQSLAAWAFGMPSGPHQWTSFVMTPTTANQRGRMQTVIPPAGAELILSLTTDSEDELTVFQQEGASRSDIDRWTRELTGQLVRAGWHEAHPWQQSADAATARFERGTMGQRQANQAIEIAVAFDGLSRITGTVNVISIPGVELVPQTDAENSLTSNRQQKS